MRKQNGWVAHTNIGALHQAHTELLWAFPFKATPEGEDYWHGIVLRLRAMEEIAREARAKAAGMPKTRGNRRGRAKPA